MSAGITISPKASSLKFQAMSRESKMPDYLSRDLLSWSLAAGAGREQDMLQGEGEGTFGIEGTEKKIWACRLNCVMSTSKLGKRKEGQEVGFRCCGVGGYCRPFLPFRLFFAGPLVRPSPLVNIHTSAGFEAFMALIR